MQSDFAGKFGEDWDDDAADAVSMIPPKDRSKTGNAGCMLGETNTWKRPSPDEAPGAARVEGTEAVRPTTGNAAKPNKEGEKTHKPSPSSQPGAYRFEGDDDKDRAVNRKVQSDYLEQAPAVYDSADRSATRIISDDDLRQAAAYHTPGVASMPTVHAKPSFIGKVGTMIGGHRAAKREAIYEKDQPTPVKSTGMNDHGLPLAKQFRQNDEISLESKLVLASVDHRESRGKRGRHGRVGSAGNSESRADKKKTVRKGRQPRNLYDDVSDGEYVVHSDDSEEESRANNDILPGARRIIGMTGLSPEVAEFDLQSEQTERNLPEEAPNVTDDCMPKATAIDEDEDVEHGTELRVDLLKAEEIEKLEPTRGCKGWLQRHKRLTLFVVTIIVAVITVSIVFGLPSDDGPNPISPFEAVYRNSTERFQLGADLLLNRG